MQQCTVASLSRLPKLPNPRSLKWKRGRPGLADSVIGFSPYKVSDAVDPTHPALANGAKRPTGLPPIFRDPHGAFSLRAVPNAILTKPKGSPPASPTPHTHPVSVGSFGESSHASVIEEKDEQVALDWNSEVKAVSTLKVGQVSMPLWCITGKATVHKSAVIRKRIASRLKAGIALVVNRGANVQPQLDKNGQYIDVVYFVEEDIGHEKWLLKDWTYIVFPSLSIYRMPYTSMIPRIRAALSAVKAGAVRSENSWSKNRARSFKTQVEPAARRIVSSQINPRAPLSGHSGKYPASASREGASIVDRKTAPVSPSTSTGRGRQRFVPPVISGDEA